MTIILIICFAISGIYLILNFKHDIHMLQQNSYRIDRYWRWLKNGNLWNASELIDIALLMLLMSTLMPAKVATILIALVAVFKIINILRKKFKKPLVFTKRVWRIYSCVGIIASLIFILASVFSNGLNNPVIPMAVLLIISIFSWILVMLSVILLQPVENAINRKFYNEAQKILRSMPDMKIIGITGSFGKTSTKHYLHRILSESFDVLMTPGSYNTPMGVIRTIREMMKPYHQVFICEMGAKQKGDIKEICDLVNPHMGIITAVGPMHLESFKSIENVQATKFELADALPSEGLVVVNNDFEYCENRKVNNVKTTRYAVSNPKNADFKAVDIDYSPNGTTFRIVGPDNFSLELYTQLIGECNISNLIAAVIIALKLNMPAERIKYAVSQIEQVEHRLNLKRTPGGVNIIDDAFNSNPAGSKMAVDVLSQFKTGKRIIVTPGMIELGDKQYELNKALGKHIGDSIDIAIIVGAYNRDALLEGVKSGSIEEQNVYAVDSFNEAQALLARILQKGDTVLYENDLPDTFK